MIPTKIVYGPERGKGRELGNTVVGDGWKYRGRGFVQLTGKANYQKYSNEENGDLVNNPDLLLNEEVAARVTVQYFKDRVKTSEDSPDYFNSALRAVGNNREDIRQKKINAYNYFLGDSTIAQTDKTTDSSESLQNYSRSINGVPIERVANVNYGFSDPNFKYPLKDYIKEPDTNRLARGVTQKTIVDRSVS